MFYKDHPLQHRKEFICIDTETTGLNSDDEIIQISIIDGFRNTLLDAYIRPDFHEEWPEAMKINQITPEMVSDKPSIIFYKERIEKILNTTPLIIGYNVDFDLNMLRQNFITLPNELNKLDVMQEYCDFTGKPRVNLKKCARELGFIPDDGYHNSKNDCLATIFAHETIYKKLYEAYLNTDIKNRGE